MNSKFYYLLLEKTVYIVMNFISFAMIAKHMGASDLGIISYSISIMAIFSVFCSFGMEKIVINEIASSNVNASKIVTNTFVIRALLSIVVFIIFIIFNNDVIYVLLLINMGFQIYQIIVYYYNANEMFIYISKINILIYTISFPFKLLSILYYKSIILYFSAIAIESLAFLLIYTYSISRNNRELFNFSYLDIYYIKKILIRAFPLLLSSSVIILYTRIDQIMIKNIIDESSLGVYSVAVKISDSISIIGQIICSISLPKISRSLGDRLDKVFIKSSSQIIIIYSLILIIALFLGQDCLYFIFGYEYKDAYLPMIILIVSTLFSVLGVMSTNYLIVKKLEKHRFYRVITGLIINIILNIILIPNYGIIGASIATLISQITSSLFGNYLNKKTKELFFLQIKSFLIYRAFK